MNHSMLAHAVLIYRRQLTAMLTWLDKATGVLTAPGAGDRVVTRCCVKRGLT